nr:hypothetical protein [Tanacetum cinerariifolium]
MVRLDSDHCLTDKFSLAPVGFWYKYGLDPAYLLVVYEPETGCWWKLPPIPEFKAGFLDICGMVASGSDLVVMGGKGRGSDEYFDSVIFFDFLSYWWRRGANRPGGHRWFFGCAADGNGTIYVAGGYDVNENPLNSAWAYHVPTDNWIKLPDMAQEHGYCKGLFHLGKFHVINGSTTNMQGHHQSLEIFDTSSTQWLLLGNSDDYVRIIKSLEYYVKGTDLKPYTHSANDIVELVDGNWQFVARLPVDVAIGPHITPFHGHLLMTSKPDYHNPHDAYILDLKDLIWTRLDVSGHVRCGCCFTI